MRNQNMKTERKDERKEREENLGDLEFVEDILKDLVILDHLVFALRVEVDLVHRHHPWMCRVHQLTVNRTGTRLSQQTQIQTNEKPHEFREKS